MLYFRDILETFRLVFYLHEKPSTWVRSNQTTGPHPQHRCNSLESAEELAFFDVGSLHCFIDCLNNILYIKVDCGLD
jgi:hypothetical protein